MRWCPSVAGTLRMVERDVELEGLKLSAGTVLYLAMVANHYDDTTYPSPERFDLVVSNADVHHRDAILNRNFGYLHDNQIQSDGL